MISIIKTISEIYKFPVKISYRLVHNTTNSKQAEPAAQENEVDDNLPITLKSNPFERERKKCILCRLNIRPDYKNWRLLSQFQSTFTGKVYGRHITGLCKHKQEAVEIEIWRAQQSGFMPTYHKHAPFIHDPKLFDPDNPFRPHKY
ncbi:28S ribosomal protein S18c, mitochondrial [Chelonus insularis]|uniref:28S ribosomal protein S18c, mitochondrial n=1 Tax=Chelonus insularis TaxID=460826 RepID=UPI00158A83E6|nr:28S ribosomal protein S18c, mitochondrial [Chelonus insularis]